jgi:hypothetical protein
MATCFETSTSSFLSVAGGDAARTRTDWEAETERGESSVVTESFLLFCSDPFMYPPVKIK